MKIFINVLEEGEELEFVFNSEDADIIFTTDTKFRSPDQKVLYLSKTPQSSSKQTSVDIKNISDPINVIESDVSIPTLFVSATSFSQGFFKFEVNDEIVKTLKFEKKDGLIFVNLEVDGESIKVSVVSSDEEGFTFGQSNSKPTQPQTKNESVSIYNTLEYTASLMDFDESVSNVGIGARTSMPVVKDLKSIETPEDLLSYSMGCM